MREHILLRSAAWKSKEAAKSLGDSVGVGDSAFWPTLVSGLQPRGLRHSCRTPAGALRASHCSHSCDFSPRESEAQLVNLDVLELRSGCSAAQRLGACLKPGLSAPRRNPYMSPGQ